MPESVALIAGNPVRVSSVKEREFDTLAPPRGFPPPAKGKQPSGGKRPANNRTASGQSAQTIAAEVLRSFNTWAFKREQPSDPNLMLQVIAAAIERQEPVPFVLYWGKGPKEKAGPPENQCLDFLAGLASRVKGVYEHGAALRLVLTDTHAELNGHSRQRIEQYFEEITWLAEQRDISTCWMGDLIKAAGNLATAAPLEDIVPEDALSKLTASATKWYQGQGTPQQGALTYLRMNLIEQRVIERAFPETIFVTFNGSELRFLFPKQMPIFYMYSLRRGSSVKPWFISPDEAVKPPSGAAS